MSRLRIFSRLGERRTPTRSPLDTFRWRLARNGLFAALTLVTAFFGFLQPFDNFLSNHRFSLLPRHPSGDVVFVEIDSASLQAVGIWPWPRTLHAQLVDQLMAMGARKAVFDIDFSSASTPENDADFAASLKRAGSRVDLAAFEQTAGAPGRRIANFPTKGLAEQASLVAIDVPIDPDGLVRDYWYERPVGDRKLGSVGAALTGASKRPGERFGLDYGVNLDEIPRLSAIDVIAGKIDPDRIRGRDVIVGASAPELRDFFMTPRFGLAPGALVHALAVETLRQGRALHDMPFAGVAALVGLLALLSAAFDRGASRLWGLPAAAVLGFLVEVGALALQQDLAIRPATAAAQVALAGFALVGVLADFALRRRQHAQSARERDVVRAMLGQVVADNFDGLAVIDAEGNVIAASRLARDLLGRDIAGRRAVDVLPEQLAAPLARALAAGPSEAGRSATPGEASLAGPEGKDRIIEFVVTVSALEGVRERRVACLTFRDITERRAHEQRLDYLARHDPLTGAWTRSRLTEEIAEFLATPDGVDKGLSVFCLDLRRFVLVNDVFGHKVGDAVLSAVVERIRSQGFAMIARLGGDSFAFAGVDEPDPHTLRRQGEWLVEILSEPYVVLGHRIIIGASLGGTTTQMSGRDPIQLLTHAGMAQDWAKRNQGDGFDAFSPNMETLRREKQAIDADLRQAIEDGSLSLQYQPKVDLATGRLVGAEALMRWHTPNGDSVSPARFIPIAEESGLIVELGRWALHRACRECAAWPSSASVAVNVSPVQFSLADIFEEVQDALARSGLPAHRLEIEITESIFVDRESEISATLTKLRALGVKIALDDFGTGYSSLHYLGRLPIDTIKIDQSFIRRLLLDANADATVQAIVSLARALGKGLVAEGIERVEQARLLASLGCTIGQGYYYGRAQDPLAFVAALAAGETAAPAVLADIRAA